MNNDEIRSKKTFDYIWKKKTFVINMFFLAIYTVVIYCLKYYIVLSC